MIIFIFSVIKILATFLHFEFQWHWQDLDGVIYEGTLYKRLIDLYKQGEELFGRPVESGYIVRMFSYIDEEKYGCTSTDDISIKELYDE